MFDPDVLPVEEYVARSIHQRFPRAQLKVVDSAAGSIYEISYEEKILLILDRRGVKYFFLSRRKKSFIWQKMVKGGAPRVVDYILRDLAEAHFEVLSNSNKRIPKRPIHISRYTKCPSCGEKGVIKLIFRGDEGSEGTSDLFTIVSDPIELNGAELKCMSCGWMGIREQIRQR